MSVKRNIKVITWFNFFLDFKLYAPVAIIYFSKVSGSFAFGMAIFSITTFISALSEIPTGIYSDKIGRRKTLILGAFCSLLASIFYAIGISFWVLAIGSIFMGLSRSFFSGNNDALLYDTLRETNEHENYHKFLGRISSMFQLALAISAILGSLVADKSFIILMWLSTIPQIICFLLSLQVVEPKFQVKNETSNIYSHIKESFSQFLTNKKLRLLSISSILGDSISEAGFLFRSTFIATLWPLWAIGFSSFLSNIGAAISFYWSGKIIDKYKPINLLLTCTIYNRIINFIAFIFPTVLSPILLASTSFNYGVTTTSENTLLQKEFTDHQRATMSSLNSLASSIVFSLFSIFLGFIADIIGPRYALLFTTFLGLSSIWLYYKIFSHDKKTKNLSYVTIE